MIKSIAFLLFFCVLLASRASQRTVESGNMTLQIPIGALNKSLEINIPSLVFLRSSADPSEQYPDMYTYVYCKFTSNGDTAFCTFRVSYHLESPIGRLSDDEFSNFKPPFHGDGKQENEKKVKKSVNGLTIFIIQYDSGFIAKGRSDDSKSMDWFLIDMRGIENVETTNKIIASINIVDR